MPGDAHAAAHGVLTRYHQAMLDGDAGALADLYAVDGVHEFPLFSPFFPPRLEGREAIGKAYGAVWAASSMRIVEIRHVAVHETQDPAVIVAEAQYTALAAGKSFDLSFAVVMRVEDGLIVHLRDYMDALGGAVALGRVQNVADAITRRARD